MVTRPQCCNSESCVWTDNWHSHIDLSQGRTCLRYTAHPEKIWPPSQICWFQVWYQFFYTSGTCVWAYECTISKFSAYVKSSVYQFDFMLRSKYRVGGFVGAFVTSNRWRREEIPARATGTRHPNGLLPTVHRCVKSDICLISIYIRKHV